MVMQELISYLSYVNPINGCIQILRGTSNILNVAGITANNAEVKYIIPPDLLWKLSKPFIQIAAVSGTIAFILKAYCSNKYHIIKDEDRRIAFKIASENHFIHTLAMFGLPMCRKPHVAGTFILLGQILFCGPNYIYAITTNKKTNKLTVIGKCCFLFGWLTMLL